MHSLVDLDSRTYASLVSKRTDIPLTFSFAGNQEALVEAIGIHPSQTKEREYPEELPARIRVFASREDLFSGYRKVGDFAVVQKKGWQRFALSSPVQARFLKVVLVPKKQPGTATDIAH